MISISWSAFLMTRPLAAFQLSTQSRTLAIFLSYRRVMRLAQFDAHRFSFSRFTNASERQQGERTKTPATAKGEPTKTAHEREHV